MRITKGIITAGGDARGLALQNLLDPEGETKSVLEVLLSECVAANVRDVAVVVRPGTENAYLKAAGGLESVVTIIPQSGEPTYAQALLNCEEFVNGEACLHLVGDHVFVSHSGVQCARQLVEVAAREECSVSGVQATRENLLTLFGTVGAQRVPQTSHLFEVDRVVEKPTPTEAEQNLIVPGLRLGHYLCFFGMHVFTPQLFAILGDIAGSPVGGTLSEALDKLAKQDRYLALQVEGTRFAIDVGYGMLSAQLALALSGKDREQVLSMVVDLVTQKELSRSRL